MHNERLWSKAWGVNDDFWMGVPMATIWGHVLVLLVVAAGQVSLDCSMAYLFASQVLFFNIGFSLTYLWWKMSVKAYNSWFLNWCCLHNGLAWDDRSFSLLFRFLANISVWFSPRLINTIAVMLTWLCVQGWYSTNRCFIVSWFLVQEGWLLSYING